MTSHAKPKTLSKAGNCPSRAGWVGVDVDGVLAAHVEHILPILSGRFAFEATFEQVRTWDFPVGNTTFGAIIREEQHSRSFVLETPFIPGAVEAMRQLYTSHHITIVTARPPVADPWTKEWLALGGVAYDRYENLRVGEKHLTTTLCDVLIDDYPVNILGYLRNTSGRAILYLQPWNLDHPELEPYSASGRLLLAQNWREILSLLSMPSPDRDAEHQNADK